MSLFNSVSLSESTYASRRVYSEYPSVRIENPDKKFADSRLTTSLALITYLADCGYSEFDSIPAVLSRLKEALFTLLRHCIAAEREVYTEYIQMLLKKTDILVGKLIVRALSECVAHVELAVCQQVIREAHELVILLYSLTNPLKIPGILSEDYGLAGPHGLRVSSFQTNHLLMAARELQEAIAPLVREAENRTEDNGTPAQLWNSILVASLKSVSKLTITVLNNSVPTSVVFLYFQALLKSPRLNLLDLEYFEEFLAHFQNIDLALKHDDTPLFDLQKSMIKEHFHEIIKAFPYYPLTWCTTAQTINYLQIFIDTYNTIYDEDLVIEYLFDDDLGKESTVVQRWSNYKLQGHYMRQVREEKPPVPDFVKYFESETDLSHGFSPGIQAGSPVANEEAVQRCQNPPQQEWNFTAAAAPKYEPQEPHFVKVHHLNDEVAEQVRNLRSDFETKYGYNKVKFTSLECIKCKYIPWHKHHQ